MARRATGYIYTSVNPSISMLGVQGTVRRETEGSETDVVLLNSFFEQLYGKSRRQYGQANLNAVKPS